MNPNIETLEQLARETAVKWFGESHVYPPSMPAELTDHILAALRAAVEPVEAQCAAMRVCLEHFRDERKAVDLGVPDEVTAALSTDAGKSLLAELQSCRALVGAGDNEVMSLSIKVIMAELRDLRDRLAKAEAVWQPIETAPRYGKWILLWWPDVTDVPFVGYEVKGKWHAATDGQTWNRLPGPTHWQPLPQPPQAALGRKAQ